MRPPAAALAVAAVALACVAAAMPSGPVLFSDHTYGLGERQTYSMERDARMTVRMARADGTISKRTVSAADASSVAFTVEGFTDSGTPVLGVATARRASPGASAAEPSATASPVVERDGSVRSDAFAELAPAAVLLNGLDAQALDIGSTWHGRGDLALPFARLAVRLNANVNFKSGDARAALLQARLDGDSSVSGHPSVAPFGALTLTGSGTDSGSAFISPSRHVLLGMELTVSSYGNLVDARGKRGTYSLVAHWSIKLAGYASGVVPGPGISPGIGIPVTRMGDAAPGATNVYSQGSPADVFHPASINPDVLDKANATSQPTPAPSPNESLPPVPIVMSSDQPLASPPPGPSPTSS